MTQKWVRLKVSLPSSEKFWFLIIYWKLLTNYFGKNLHLRCLTEFRIRFWTDFSDLHCTEQSFFIGNLCNECEILRKRCQNTDFIWPVFSRIQEGTCQRKLILKHILGGKKFCNFLKIFRINQQNFEENTYFLISLCSFTSN